MRRSNKGKGKRWNQCPVLGCENPMSKIGAFCWEHTEQLPQAIKDGLRDAHVKGNRLEWLNQQGLGRKHFAELSNPSPPKTVPDYSPLIGEKPLKEQT